MGARRHHCTAVRLGRWSESGRGRARTPSIRQSCLTSARALCRKTSNESVRKPAAILNAQRGDRPEVRYALQTCRPAPRLWAGAPAYWFGRSPKLVVILLLGPLLLLFFRELRLLRLLAGKGWGWKLFVFMMTRRAFFAAEAVLNFLLASRKLLSHAETLIKKRRAELWPYYIVPFL